MESDSDFEGSTGTSKENMPPKANQKTDMKKQKTQKKRKSTGSSESSRAKKRKASTSKGSAKEKSKSSKSTASKPKPKTLGLDEAMIKIEGYLVDQNRPYSHTQVFENLHRIVKKSMVPVVLKRLADRGGISEQIFGKTKLYYVNQAKFKLLDSAGLSKLDDEIKELKGNSSALSSTIKGIKAEINGLVAELPDDLLQKEIESKTNELKEKQERLEALKSNQTCYSKETLKAMDDELGNMMANWKKYKRAVTDMVDMILESSNMKKSKLEEKIGIETDKPAEDKFKEITKRFRQSR